MAGTLFFDGRNIGRTVPGSETSPKDTAGARLLTLLIAVGLAGQLALALRRQINWDEFYFLSRIFEYRSGTLADLLLTFHVHLFGWLAAVPGGEVTQIVAGRVTLLVTETGTLVAIYKMARRFVPRTTSLFAVLAYATSGNVLLYGASFRFDPIATFAMMSALALLLTSSLRWPHAALAGVLIAVGGLVTIKSVFYLPPVIAVSLWRLAHAQDPRRTFRALATGAAASLFAYLALETAHAHLLAGAHTSSRAEAFLAHSVNTMLRPGEILSRWPYLTDSIARGFFLWLAAAAGVIFCAGRVLRTRGRDGTAWMMLSFAFPAATVLFYRNSFPYYYVFALAPATLLAAVAVQRFVRSSASLLRVGCATVVIAAVQFLPAFGTTSAAQHTTLQAIHAMFPDPVNYIDRCSMVAQMPKSGFFMSTWGVETYRARRQPSFPQLLREEQPIFVLANAPQLRAALTSRDAGLPENYTLLDRDARALRENYIHHWGPIWVAGKEFGATAAGRQSFDILIDGPYTLEAASGVLIDARTVSPGEVLQLNQGRHTLNMAGASGSVRLRWGDHLLVPAAKAPEENLFNGF